MQDCSASRIASLVRGLIRTARLMVGLPDYESYVVHRRQVHPGEDLMSYEEFFRERQASRLTAETAKRAGAADRDTDAAKSRLIRRASTATRGPWHLLSLLSKTSI